MLEQLKRITSPRYIGPRFYPPEVIYHFIEILSLLPVGAIETGGTEANIPKTNHIGLFTPHSGIEIQPIDRLYRVSGRMPPVWVTKIENVNGLPAIFGGSRRFIFMDRDQPGPSLFKNIHMILQNEQGCVATAIEGTRFGNPNDKSDMLSLKRAEPGFVRIARNECVPILPIVILGGDQFLATLDKIKETCGMKAAVKEYIRELRRKPKPIVHIRFAKPYDDHIYDNLILDSAKQRQEHAQYHADRIMREMAIPIIRELNPEYPLGYYAEPSQHI